MKKRGFYRFNHIFEPARNDCNDKGHGGCLGEISPHLRKPPPRKLLRLNPLNDMSYQVELAHTKLYTKPCQRVNPIEIALLSKAFVLQWPLKVLCYNYTRSIVRLKPTTEAGLGRTTSYS